MKKYIATKIGNTLSRGGSNMRQYGATRLFCSGNMGQQGETNNWFSQNPRQSEQINLWLKWSNVASLFILPYFPFSGATQIFEVREPKTKFYLVLIFPIRMKHPWEFLGIDKLQSGSKCKQIIGCPTFHIAPYFEVGLQENQKEMEQCCSTFHIAPYCPPLSLKYSRDTCHQVITTGAMWWVSPPPSLLRHSPPKLCYWPEPVSLHSISMHYVNPCGQYPHTSYRN